MTTLVVISEKDLDRKQRTKQRYGYKEIMEFVRIQKQNKLTGSKMSFKNGILHNIRITPYTGITILLTQQMYWDRFQQFVS